MIALFDKQKMSSSLLFCWLLLMISTASAALAVEKNYITNKVRLGSFKVQSGTPINGTNSVRWWDIENIHVAADDLHRIYILDVYNSRVLIFSPDGALLKVVMLKGTAFPFTNKGTQDGYMQYMIQVSADGAFIYVTSGTKEYNWTIFDNRGNPIKKNIVRDVLFDRRYEGNKFVGFYAEFDMLDADLNIMKHLKSHIVQGEVYDTSSNTYVLDRTLVLRRLELKKIDPNGQKIWQREIRDYKSAEKILGFDGNGNVYVLMGGPYEIVKIDTSGQIIGKIVLPADVVGSTDKILRTGRFLILCDGTIYFIPPISSINKQYQKSFLNRGEYAIYQFESIK